jgi:hypothetical protein
MELEMTINDNMNGWLLSSALTPDLRLMIG